MGFHTYPLERADALDDPERYRYCSREELLEAILDGPTGTVLDLGCGTGFFTLDVATFVERVLAVDVQPAMLSLLREKSPPVHVHPITATADGLPLLDESVAVAFSTMTYHEYATPTAHAEVRRVLQPDGRVIAIDWTRDGDGESGPPLEERYNVEMVVDQLQSAGFHVIETVPRPETFVVIARPT